MAKTSSSANANPNVQQQPDPGRSGFQPYRPDERLTHPAGVFPSLDTFATLNSMSMHAGSLFNPTFQYSDFMDPRLSNMYRAPVGHPAHAAHAMYPHFPAYASQLYSMLPNASLPMGIPNMMKMVEEEQRLRLREEELRQQKLAKELEEKQRQKEAQREKERKEREKREKEQRLKEQREKEQRIKEQRERERE